MKKLNVALLVVVLFAFSCFTIASSIQNSIMPVVTTQYCLEYRVGETEEVKAEYYEEPVVVKTTARSTNYASSGNAPASNMGGRLGDIGRLSIPSVGYSAALYNGLPLGSQGAQRIIDNYDSACWLNYNMGTVYIGDHNYQGFERMKQAIPGVTRAYITWADGTTSTYLCVSMQYNCRKQKAYIYDQGNNLIFSSGYSIAMSTCNYDSQRDANGNSIVTVSYWNEI